MTKQIYLPNGLVVLVDDEDYDRLSVYNWSISGTNRIGYARRARKTGLLQYKNQYMHREILGIEDPNIFIDHKDGNTLNNQKSNLRLCNQSQNLANQGKQRDNTSGYKGVSWHKNRKTWVGHVSHENKQVHVGVFDTAIEAAKAVDKKAIELFGEFAHLNFPEG